MDNIRTFYRPTYMELLRTIPEWPLSFEMTKMFILDMAGRYTIIELNLDQVACNIRYNGVIIKNDVFVKTMKFLIQLRKR